MLEVKANKYYLLTGNSNPKVSDLVVIYNVVEVKKGTEYTFSLNGETVSATSAEDQYLEEHYNGVVTAVENGQVTVFSPLFLGDCTFTQEDRLTDCYFNKDDALLMWLLEDEA